MKEIRHIFFDLDHTLWDYDRSAQETLRELFSHFGLDEERSDEKQFIDTFYKVNDQLWRQYNDGQLDRDYIKTKRFERIFEMLGYPLNQADGASVFFISHCSKKPYLMPDAITALRYLKSKYTLHVITNGFKESQANKIARAGLGEFFEVIVTSECIGVRKPSREIFEYALEKAGALSHESVMIGDNPKTDIKGAREVGLLTVFYDPSGKRRSLADIVIQSHMELIQIF